MSATILHGEALEQLRALPDASAHCCITSPPYFRLRDYGDERQLGMEADHHTYVARLVAVMREVRRVLRPEGTLWLNLGDSYAGTGAGNQGKQGQRASRRQQPMPKKIAPTHGVKYKDLFGVPWRVALALQDDGWWLRSDIIWHKTNPTPASVADRPTSSHEYLFLLARSEVYHYDAEAIREPAHSRPHGARARRYLDNEAGRLNTHVGRVFPWEGLDGKRNRRSVWTISTEPSDGDHPAPMPRRLVEPCILAGCQAGGVVLDPFSGSGTVGLMALRLGRSFIGIELRADWAQGSRELIANDAPLFQRGGAS